MAKINNLEMYVENIKGNINILIEDILFNEITDKNASDLFYHIYPSEFVFNPQQKNWYCVNEFGIYLIDDGDIELKRKINESMLKKITQIYTEMLNGTDNDKKILLSKNYKSIISYLGKVKTKEAIVKELELLFRKKYL